MSQIAVPRSPSRALATSWRSVMVPEPLGSSGWHGGRRRCRFGCRLPPAQRSSRVGAVWAAMPGVKSWPMIAVCCALRRLCRPTPPPPSPRRTASTNEVLDDGDHHHPWRDRPVPGADHSARRCIHPLDSSLPLPPHTLSTSRAPTGLVGRAPGKPNKKTTQKRVPWPFAAAQSGRLDVYQVPDSDVPPPPLPSFSEHHESLARWPDHAAQ